MRSFCRVYHCALWFTLDTSPGRTDFVHRGASLGKLLPGMILQQVQSGRRYQSASIRRPFRLPGALVEWPGRIHSDGGILSREQRARKSRRRFISGDRNPGPKLFPDTGTCGHGGGGPGWFSGSSAQKKKAKSGSSGTFMSGDPLFSIFLAQRREGAEKKSSEPYNSPDHSR